MKFITLGSERVKKVAGEILTLQLIYFLTFFTFAACMCLVFFGAMTLALREKRWEKRQSHRSLATQQRVSSPCYLIFPIGKDVAVFGIRKSSPVQLSGKCEM